MNDNNNDDAMMDDEGSIDVVRAVELEINALANTPNRQQA